MVVVGLAIVWWSDHRELLAARKAAKDADLSHQVSKEACERWMGYFLNEKAARMRRDEEVAALKRAIGELGYRVKDMPFTGHFELYDPAKDSN